MKIYNYQNGHLKKTFTDVSVVRAFQEGDHRLQCDWYGKCIQQFGTGTSQYAGISDYEKHDLFEDSFIILWEKMESGQIFVKDNDIYVMGKDGEKIVPDILGYFMRIVKNKYLELFHSGTRIVPLGLNVTSPTREEVFNELYWDEDPEVEKDRIVVKCLQSLPKSCLDILTKFYYERKSLEQILEERPENTSYDGLKSRKSKCLKNLKNRITESFLKAGLR